MFGSETILQRKHVFDTCAHHDTKGRGWLSNTMQYVDYRLPVRV